MTGTSRNVAEPSIPFLMVLRPSISITTTPRIPSMIPLHPFISRHIYYLCARVAADQIIIILQSNHCPLKSIIMLKPFVLVGMVAVFKDLPLQIKAQTANPASNQVNFTTYYPTYEPTTSDAPTKGDSGPDFPTYAPTSKEATTEFATTNAPTMGNFSLSFPTYTPTPGEDPPVETKSPTPTPTESPETALSTTTSPTSISSYDTMAPSAASNNVTTAYPTRLPASDEESNSTTSPNYELPVESSISSTYASALEGSPTGNSSSLVFVSYNVGFVLSLVTLLGLYLVN